MCKQYQFEFWTPLPNTLTAEFERRIRGHARVPLAPGQGDIITFYVDCRDRSTFMMNPRCPLHKVTYGGTVDGGIQPFCKMDHNCANRLQRFEVELNRRRAELWQAEKNHEAKQYQRNIAIQWRVVWREWVSAYEHHKDCSCRRESHPTYQKLRRMITIGPTFGRAERLGTNPHTHDEPQVGFERY